MCRKGNKIHLLKIIGNNNESAVDETNEPKIDELVSNPDLAGKC